MAVVYLADDLKHHRQVAIKVLKPELAASVGAERFLREIEIAAQLTHPHILPLHDSGEADGFLYYVMPYVDGESLRGRLTREGPLPIPDAVRILRDVADALAHAHAHGVVHRDIKPDNVMLSERHALVTDFGIGKAVSGAATPQTLTTAGVSLGTPAYMAPEQATADKNIDHRADIYALGVVGYEMLAGEAPIKGDNQQEVLAAQVLETPEPITRVRENLPRPLAQLLMRCLEKRREDRWQTAEEVLGRLEVLTTPSGGTTPTWARLTPVRTLRFKRITRWSARVGLGVAAVAAASVIGVLAVRGVGASGASLDPDLVAVAALENETADPSLDPLGRLAAEWITQGVQQRGVAAVVSTEAALAAAQASAGLTAADRVGAFAEATAAGVVLHGSYYVLGDSLQFQIQITDAAEGQLLSAMAPVTGPRTTASQGLGELRERTLAALAATLDFRAGDLGMPMQPRRLEVYRLYRQGQDASSRSEIEEALGFYREAWATDSTFLPALLEVGSTLQALRRDTDADSVLRVAAAYRARMSEAERLRLQFIQETDVELRLHTAQRLAEITPWWAFFAGTVAWQAYRPDEALVHFARVAAAQRDGRYWDQVSHARHMLQRHEEELEDLRAARGDWPDQLVLIADQLGALAALGRIGLVDALFDTLFALPTTQAYRGIAYSPVTVMRLAAQELRAHGHTEAARAALLRAIAWLETQPEALAPRTAPDYRSALAGCLYGLERWKEARGLYQGLHAEMPEQPGFLFHLGAIAARMGNRDVAQKMSDELTARGEITDQRWLQADIAVDRGRIAALLGEREEAVRLLRVGFDLSNDRGWDVRLIGHYAEFESVRDFPPFQQFMRPRG
jgi:tetratricopeptide (TPR) repeat protein